MTPKISTEDYQLNEKKAKELIKQLKASGDDHKEEALDRLLDFVKHDLQEARQAYEKDPVTGVCNINTFMDRVAAEVEPEKSDSIVYFNVSGFKVYNDTFGLQEGNRCLQYIADMLSDTFGGEHVARFFADHFLVYYKKNDVVSKIRKCHDRLLKHETGFKLWLEAGIVYPYSYKEDISSYCDYAKLACDSIKNNGIDFYNVYSEDMSENLIQKKYLQDHIEQAIEEGRIEVYYQPIVRALTGKVCGFEALARWNDPVYGMLSPGLFVPALEERHLSSKLDSYIVNRVCSDMSERRRAKGEIVPVSVNFSRRDFISSDPVKIVEDAARKYGISHEYLNVEITETATMEDSGNVRELIRRFHNAGYRVYMDDFGSAYSSLNTLSEFRFDVIKLDMVFMRNFNEKTRRIVRSVIQMAKTLKIHTLAEGVETKEQLEILKEYGCEKIQGFLYGKPLPMYKQLENLEKNNIGFETQSESQAFDSMGHILFQENEMFAVSLYYNDEYHCIFENQKMRSHFRDMGYKGTLEETDGFFNSSSLTLGVSMRRAAGAAAESPKMENIVVYTVVDGHDLRYTVRKAASVRDVYILWVSVVDLTGRNDLNQESEYSGLFRDIANACHTIYRVDFEHRRVEVVVSIISGEKPGSVISGLPDKFLYERVYYEDRARFLKSCTEEYAKRRMKETGLGYFSDFYRIKSEDGSYVWNEVMVMGVVRNGRIEYLCCIKSMYNSDGIISSVNQYPDAAGGDISLEKSLWDSLLAQADIELFWKDTDRKMLGVSRSYLENNHIDRKELIGRDDHELGWHMNDRTLQNDDEEILKRGKVVYRRQEQKVVDGRIRNIITSKFPIYRKGRIAGILGYSVEPAGGPSADSLNVPLNDPDTGMLTEFGFIYAFAVLEEDFQKGGSNYLLAFIELPVYNQLWGDYGLETGEALMRQAAGIGRKYVGKNNFVARIGGGVLAVLGRDRAMEQQVASWCAALERIIDVNGHACTVRAYSGIASRKDGRNPIDLCSMSMSVLTDSEGQYNKLSPEALRLRVRYFRKIFNRVQLVDPPLRKCIALQDEKYMHEEENCWENIGIDHRCENCIAMRTLRSGNNDAKLELMNGRIYLMRSFYSEVEGKPYVIETASLLDEKWFDDLGGRNVFIKRLRRMNHEIYHDSLTGLYNRRFYDEQMAEMMVEAVVFIDIDSFKKVNDTYGHHSGDMLMRKVAAAINGDTVEDEFIARYGGDEFVIAYKTMPDQMELRSRLERIRDRIARIRHEHDGRDEVMCSASMGAVFGRGLVKYLILDADHELYMAKAAGRGVIFIKNNAR